MTARSSGPTAAARTPGASLTWTATSTVRGAGDRCHHHSPTTATTTNGHLLRNTLRLTVRGRGGGRNEGRTGLHA